MKVDFDKVCLGGGIKQFENTNIKGQFAMYSSSPGHNTSFFGRIFYAAKARCVPYQLRLSNDYLSFGINLPGHL